MGKQEPVRLVTAGSDSWVAERVDVRSCEALSQVTERTHREYGRIDILVNVGDVHWRSFGELSDGDWRDVIDVNVHRSVDAIQYVLPDMARQGYGRIVCTGSTLRRTGGRNLCSYSACTWAGAVQGVTVMRGASGNPHTGQHRDRTQRSPRVRPDQSGAVRGPDLSAHR